nr:MAG TPA: replisome organizer protein [Caudoviricetes sp.]
MGKDKKYYWLKLKTNFFDSKEMLRLRSIAGGDTYTIIYLKMLLLSLKTDGLLEYDGIDATQDEEIALLLRENLDNVKLTIAFLKRVGLLEMVNKNDFFLNQVPTLTGGETQGAERQRRHRENVKALQCHADVTPPSQNHNARDKSIEIEKENKSKKDKTYSPSLPSVAEDIVTFLNSTVGSNYKSTTGKTRKLIAARLAEGFTLEDFKTVITKKAKEWQGTDMAQYLRPETLFGTKFEGYLNQPEVKNNRRSPLSRAEQERQEGIEVVNRLIAEYEEEERQNEQIGHNEGYSTFTTSV